MNRAKHAREVVIAIVVLALAVLACGGGGAGEGPTVTISSPPSGTVVAVGQETQIVSMSAADAGVERVELSINGQVVRTDAPPEGNPTSFSVAQPWTPLAEGEVTVAVVAYDTSGAASEPAMITLQVRAGVGEVTVEPGPTPTPEPDVAGEGGCTLNASYVADVTIPDDTELAPGTSFVKTWRLRNSGTCDWGEGFTLVFVSGDQMGGPASVQVPATAAGSTVDVNVNLVAPGSPGTYRGNWRMRSDTGTVFGTQVYVQIVVPAPATSTPEPTNTPEPTEEPSGPSNLQATLQADGTVRFTWTDAVGEDHYSYEFSFATDSMGAGDTSTLPADTTTFSRGPLDCGGDGSFVIIALDGDGAEIGRATVNFTTPDCEEETLALSPIASKSGDMSTGGCSAAIRAGIAPAGNGIRGFAGFDISPLHGATIVAATLDLSDYTLEGDPFEFLHPLRVEQIEFSGNLCGSIDNLDTPSLASLGNVSAASPGLNNPLDVTAALSDYLSSGDPNYFLVRMRWEHDDAGGAFASMINWSTVRLTVVYQP